MARPSTTRRVNWMYQAEPDPGLNGQRDYYPRGKILGGSSSINAMVYIRGQPRTTRTGSAPAIPAGAGTRCCPPTRRSRTMPRAIPPIADGAGRCTSPTSATTRIRCASNFIAASEAAGLAFNADFNGAEQEGVGLYQLTTKGGRRMSAARAFLRPAMRRKNLKVETHAQVTRMLFEGSARHGRRLCAARREPDGDGAARGDPVGRRHQLAAASAALGHRAGRAAAAASAFRCCSTMPMSAPACRTITASTIPGA